MKTMTLNFLIKHRSSGKFFHPTGGGPHPENGTKIVLHQDIHEHMHWTFEKVTGHWGYIKHVSSGKIIHPEHGSLNPGNGTKLVLHSDRHWAALFALDSANDYVIHKGGRYAHPVGGSPNPSKGTTVVLHSGVHDAMRFQFVSTSDRNEEVLVYGNPTMVGKWKMLYMVLNPIAEHVEQLQMKIGKSATESVTGSFKYKWERSGGLEIGIVKASASESFKAMFEKTASATWSSETTRTSEIRVIPGKSVVTWQFVFDVQQGESRSVFQSDLFEDTDSETKEPEALQYKR
ncbi:galactose-binding lectin-like [Mercenaria mercenaria]|uniref:galactose-binding lectin-like n=1 Tax=Mercenaria mercenaria TaxID=6596 RepID=UPI00234EE312|nr:galactose-binding lectin-like [Mercenaria mercenaria]